jgi:hypothetical protein
MSNAGRRLLHSLDDRLELGGLVDWDFAPCRTCAQSDGWSVTMPFEVV